MKCTKSLNTFNVIEITFGIVKLKMKKVYGDEIFRVESRLTDILTSGMLIPRKKELIKLLKKVNKIYAKSYDDFKEVLEESKKIMKSIIKNYPLEMMGYTYIFGKINVLTSMINSILDTINDYEEDNKLLKEKDEFSEEDKKVIEESKKREVYSSYIG